MKIIVVAECEMDDLWISEEDGAKLSDDEIIELAHEDLSSLLEKAKFSVRRVAESECLGDFLVGSVSFDSKNFFVSDGTVGQAIRLSYNVAPMTPNSGRLVLIVATGFLNRWIEVDERGVLRMPDDHYPSGTECTVYYCRVKKQKKDLRDSIVPTNL